MIQARRLMFRKLALLLIAGLVILPFTSAATRSPAADRSPTVQPADTAALIASVPAISVAGAGHSELLGGLLAASLGVWLVKNRIA